MSHEVLDEKILEAVRQGHRSHTTIYEHLNGVRHQAKGTVVDKTLLERRLLALQKRRCLVRGGSPHRTVWYLPKENTA